MLSGPVKTAFGYYVFTVDKIDAGEESETPRAGVARRSRRSSPSSRSTRGGDRAADRAREEVERAHHLPQRLRGPVLLERAEGLDRRSTGATAGALTADGEPPARADRGRAARRADPPAAPRVPLGPQQDARSIVAHTVEEAYELADAAHARRRREAAGRARRRPLPGALPRAAARGARRRRPRGGRRALRREAGPPPPARVRRRSRSTGADGGAAQLGGDQAHQRRAVAPAGVFADVPENLPALSLAARVQRRAGRAAGAAALPCSRPRRRSPRSRGAAGASERFDAVGDALFALVRCARALGVDPELALRARRRAAAFRDGAAPRVTVPAGKAGAARRARKGVGWLPPHSAQARAAAGTRSAGIASAAWRCCSRSSSCSTWRSARCARSSPTCTGLGAAHARSSRAPAASRRGARRARARSRSAVDARCRGAQPGLRAARASTPTSSAACRTTEPVARRGVRVSAAPVREA